MLRSFLVIAIAAASCQVNADVINGNYEISGNAGFNMAATNFAASNTFASGVPVSITEPGVVTTSFNFSGGTLDLDVSVLLTPTVTVPNPLLLTPLTWTFSALNLGGETIVGITESVATGSILGFTSNSITITTPTDLSGMNSFSFNVLDSGTAAAVPEPSSVAMLCALGLGGVWVRRRRQASAA